eukprot:scaffold12690_cov177-Cylindrotheca_fusiformis.AAC.1
MLRTRPVEPTLTQKLDDCGVFGVSSHEYLNYAQNNRDEWAREGEGLVKEYLGFYPSGLGFLHAVKNDANDFFVLLGLFLLLVGVESSSGGVARMLKSRLLRGWNILRMLGVRCVAVGCAFAVFILLEKYGIHWWIHPSSAPIFEVAMTFCIFSSSSSESSVIRNWRSQALYSARWEWIILNSCNALSWRECWMYSDWFPKTLSFLCFQTSSI